MKTSVISAAIHLAVVALYMMLTPTIDYARPKPERPTIIIYRPPPPTPANPGSAHPGQESSIIRENVIQPPTTVPPSMPPIDVAKSGPVKIVAGDTTWDTGPKTNHTGTSGSGQQSPTGVLSADIVDVQVSPYDGAPTPRYPEALRSAGVEGEVIVEFVVDTSGRMEPGSVRKISSTADAFVVSVCDALAATRYHPALVAGRRVRQLVRQQFVFSLTPH